MYKHLLVLFALSLMALGCGKKEEPAPAPAAVAACSAGLVQSAQYGCIPQAHCGAGAGYHQNQCIHLTTGAPISAGYGGGFQGGYNGTFPGGYNGSYPGDPNAGYYYSCPQGTFLHNNVCLSYGQPTPPTGSPTVSGGFVGGFYVFNQPNAASLCQGSCPVGQVSTRSFGCLPQAPQCGQCMGLYQGASCVPAGW